MKTIEQLIDLMSFKFDIKNLDEESQHLFSKVALLMRNAEHVSDGALTKPIRELERRLQKLQDSVAILRLGE